MRGALAIGAALFALLLLDAAPWTAAPLGLSTLAVGYLGVRREVASSAACLLALLIPLDAISGAPGGLAALGAVAGFLACRPAARRLGRPWSLLKSAFCAACALIAHALAASFYFLGDPGSPEIGAALHAALPYAGKVALISWPLGHALFALERALTPSAPALALS